MTTLLNTPELTFVFLATVASLATALVWMFYESERTGHATRVRSHIAQMIRNRRSRRDECGG